MSHKRPCNWNKISLVNKDLERIKFILLTSSRFCVINDLNEGGISLQHIYKRQVISPFNLFYNQNDIIELVTIVTIVTRQLKYLKKQQHKQLAQVFNKSEREELM